jgi:hypothetical protein
MSVLEVFWLAIFAILTDATVYISLSDPHTAPALWASAVQTVIILGGLGLHLVLKELRAIRRALERHR